MIDAPDGYIFTVDYEKSQQYSWDAPKYYAIVELWKIGDQVSGCVDRARIELLGKTEAEIVNAVEFRAEEMLKHLAIDSHFQDIINRHWS